MACYRRKRIMNKSWIIEAAIASALLGACTAASASITISQGSTGTTYDTTLNFDELGGPTGVVATNSWAALGLAVMDAGDGTPIVDDFAQPWIGTDNAFFGNFGVFMTFDTGMSNLSGQFWDPSGAPSPFGGGLLVSVWNDGAEVANSIVTPSWGGVGDEWIDISADGGMEFDEVRVLGFGFDPTTYADNLSWSVPSPSGVALLAFGGAVGFRRRR
jgi:hypothetical protein